MSEPAGGLDKKWNCLYTGEDNMTCGACGNDRAHRWRRYEDGSESCDRCGQLGSAAVPDVFFQGPYLDPNLAHPKRPWEKDGVWVESRQHKARLMAEQGLREAGDRRGGERIFDPSLARKVQGQGKGWSSNKD